MKKKYFMRFTSVLTSVLMIITLFQIAPVKVNAVDYETVIWPVQGNWHTVTSVYGPRQSGYHYAIDISCVIGTNIIAVASGKVVSVKTGWNQGMGSRVVLDHGNSIYTAYQHLSEILVSEGDIVEQGQVIALSGNTGDSTGPHLDFHVKINSGTDISFPKFFNKNPLDNFLPYDGYIAALGTNVKSTPYTLVAEYKPGPKTPDIQLSNGKFPVKGYNHTLGHSFGIGGTVVSNNKITRIWGGVYNRVLNFTSKTSVYIDYNPNSTVVNLGDYVNNNLIFNNLPKGIYTFKLEAEDSTGYKVTLVDNDFTAGLTANGQDNEQTQVPDITSNITISGKTEPPNELKKGSMFGLYGEINSNLNILKILGGIYYHGTDDAIQYVEAAPSSKYYSLHGIFNDRLLFDSLPVGNYTYKIYAKDLLKTYTLCNKDFRIYDNSPAPVSSMSISGQSIPTSLKKNNSGFGIYGNITSNLPITVVWGGLYYDDWTVTSQYAEAYPNTKTYSLYPYFDNKLIFNYLAEGSYHYLIKARDTSGKDYTLINSKFTIGDLKPKINASVSDLQLSLDTHESKTVSYSFDNCPAGCQMNVEHTTYITDTKWYGNNLIITPTGSGTEVLTVNLLSNNQVIASHNLTVKVTGQGAPKVNANVSELNLSMDNKVSKSIKYEFIDAPYGSKMSTMQSDSSVTDIKWDGWNLIVNPLKCGTNVITVGMVSDNKTIAVHQLKVLVTSTLNVKIDLNTGRLIDEPKTSYAVKYGETYSFLSTLGSPIKLGASFAGWYTDKTGGSKVTSNSIVDITSDHILYAHWIYNKCKVEFKVLDDTFNSRMVCFDEAYGELPTPILKEYEFLGWFTEPDGGDEVTKDSIVRTIEDHTVYAHLEKKIPVAIEKFELKKTSIDLSIGHRYFLNFNSDDISFESDNPTIATVTDDGIITALSAGEVIIKITNSENNSLQLIVNVEETNNSYATIDMNSDGTTDSYDIEVFQNYFIHNPENESFNLNADVNMDGVVNILDFILAKNSVIDPIVLPEIKSLQDTVEVYQGEIFDLDARVYFGEEEQETILEWITSDDSIVTVGSEKFEAINPGRAIVTAIYNYNDNQYRKDFYVTVKDEPYIKFKYSSIMVESGDGYQFKLSNNPEDAIISWKVSEPEYASVSDDGVLMVTVDGGELFFVTATINVNGREFKDTCTVYGFSGNYSLPSELILNTGSTKNLKVGGWSGALFDSQPVWTSSNNDIVHVDDFGNVYGVSKGTAVVTADIYHDGKDYIFECEVTVNE